MDIETTIRRDIQYLRRQDFAVRRNHHYLRLQASQLISHLGTAEGLRLKYGEVLILGEALDSRRLKRKATTLGAVGLSVNSLDLIP